MALFRTQVHTSVGGFSAFWKEIFRSWTSASPATEVRRTLSVALQGLSKGVQNNGVRILEKDPHSQS